MPLDRLFRRISFVVIAQGAALSVSGAHADPLAACQAANPAFPALCPCAVAQAEAAGFTDPVLSELLSHDFSGATPQQVQQFGMIFVQCTQQAVAGGMPAIQLPGAEAFGDAGAGHGASPGHAMPATPGEIADGHMATAPGGGDAAEAGIGAENTPMPTETAPAIGPMDSDPGQTVATEGPVIDLDPPRADASATAIDRDPVPQATGATPAIDLDPEPRNAEPVPEITLDPAPAREGGVAIDLDPPKPVAPEAAIDLDPAPRMADAAASGSTAATYQFEFSPLHPKTIGTWVPFVSVKTAPPWAEWGPSVAGGGAIFDPDGGFLVAGCNPHQTPVLTVGPVGGDHLFATARVLVRGAGGILFEAFGQADRIEHELLQIALRGEVISALRRGSSVEIEATARGGDGPDLTRSFGLKGSADALQYSGSCRPDSGRVGHGNELVNGRWERRYEKLPDGLSGPVARFAHHGGFERPVLRCDRRLRIDGLELWYVEEGSAPDYEAAPNYALRVDGNARYEVHFVRDNQFVATGITRAPLPDALVAEMAAGAALSVVPMMGEPGFGTARGFELRDIAGALDGLVCPDTLPRPATARVDLTTVSAGWTGGDLAELVNPGAPDADPIPFASLDTGEDSAAPGLSLDCSGLPFFWENFGAHSPSFDVHIVVDGEEARRATVDYLNWRALFNPDEAPADLGSRILSGTTLRLTSAANPDVDVLYPLTGARDALVSAGCRF